MAERQPFQLTFPYNPGDCIWLIHTKIVDSPRREYYKGVPEVSGPHQIEAVSAQVTITLSGHIKVGRTYYVRGLEYPLPECRLFASAKEARRTLGVRKKGKRS